MHIDFGFPQRIVMMAGPSGCGKSSFCQKQLIPWLESQAISFHYLSSDNLRRELLRQNFPKHDKRMGFVSKQAFDQLYSRLDSLTQYPVNSGMVILDATFLQADAREKVLAIAKKNNYPVDLIVFEYKNRNHYTDHLTSHDEKATANRHLRTFKTSFWKEMKRRRFSNIFKIKGLGETASLEFSMKKQWDRCHLDSKFDYVVIGDVHGCLTELKMLVEKHGFKIENNLIVDGPPHVKFVLVGDYVDKGPNCVETVDFLFSNQQHFHIVFGNHENFVYKWLKGKLKDISFSDDLRKSLFSSTEEFKEKETLEKFFHLVENSSPFLKGSNFIVTHADCETRYLGKLDVNSLKEQRNTRVMRKDEFEDAGAYLESREKQLSYLMEEANYNSPYHIFGHHALKKKLSIKNKICIDTGCVHGGSLTSVSPNTGGKPFFSSISLQGESNCPEKLDLLFERKQVEKVDLSELSGIDLRRLRKLVNRKVNFISGTMAPSDRNLEKKTLESIETALSYYKTRGVAKVIVQPKWMGSRGNLYLNCRDLSESFFTSRSGVPVREYKEEFDFGVKGLSGLFPTVFEQIKKIGVLDLDKYQWLVLDGELMPWHALGESLIDRTFRTVGQAIESELEGLQENGFFSELARLTDNFEKSGFRSDANISRKDLAKKYGHHVLESYSTLRNFSVKDPEWQKEQIKRYKDQIEIYGSPGPLEFKPFSILKAVCDEDEGIEEFFFDMGNSWCYKAVTLEAGLELDLDDPEAAVKGQEFFEDLTIRKKMEGVVVKPADRVYLPKIAPYLKVRNKNYLSIIYGFDYEHPAKFQRLLNQKNVQKKISTSVREFEIGKEMLEIKRKDISKSNQNYLSLAASFFVEEKREKELDPRL